MYWRSLFREDTCVGLLCHHTQSADPLHHIKYTRNTLRKMLPQVFQEARNLLLYFGGGHLEGVVKLAVDELKHLQKLFGGRRLQRFGGHRAQEPIF